MLRDVTHKVTDGLLGFAAASGDGRHLKIGASPISSGTPIVITGDMDAAKIQAQLGRSPLADAAMDAVQFGAGRLYCLPVAASTAGSIGEVSKTGTGIGTLSVTGAPVNAFAVAVRITTPGERNTAAFQVSLDDGSSFGDELTIPVSGTYEIPDTGLTIRFSEASAEQENVSFLTGDAFRFSTTAPAMTNGDVLAALQSLRDFSEEYEFIHIVGPGALPFWKAVSEAQAELRDVYHKPVFVLLEATYPTPEDGKNDLTDWALEMETQRKQIQNYDIQVCAAWGRLVKLDGTTQIVNLAGVASGLYAKANVQESIGKTRTEAGFGIPRTSLQALLPPKLDSTVLERLDRADYLTFREYDGLDGFYVYHAKMMSPAGSDFRYAEDVRVKNKIIRETRKEGLQLLGDDIDLEDVQGELEARAKFMFAPLQKMIDAGEISAAQILVPEGQEQTILEDETMRVRVRYVSRGYIREVEVDLGRSQPGA